MDNHQKQCKVCAFGPENLDGSLSNQALSVIVDCSKDSVRRHRDWANANGFEFASTNTTSGHDFPDTGVPGTWRPRRHWQTPSSGSLNSFEFVPDVVDIETHIDNERIDRLILNWVTVPPAGLLTGAPELAFPADLQLGKAGEAGGGTDETIQRFYDSLERVAQRWIRNKPQHGYLCDMGDLVENLYSTPSQASTNDRTLPEQIEDAVAIYMNAIGRLRPLVGTLHFATVTSNHGEARSAPKVNPYGSENDWGLTIFRLIQGKCEDRGWDVVFHRPDINEDTTVLDLPNGIQVALTHGHHSSSPVQVKAWVMKQMVGRRPGWDADWTVLGHYHHSYHDIIGDGRTIFGTPALDPGSAWFTRKSGESCPPGITVLTADHEAPLKWRDHSVL